MARGEGVGSIIVGAIFFIVGLVTLLVPEIPVICIGALIFGPIIMLYGIYKELRRPAVQYTCPPQPYYQQPYGQPQYSQQYPPSAPQQVYLCPKCGFNLRYIEWNRRWYCDRCGEFV